MPLVLFIQTNEGSLAHELGEVPDAAVGNAQVGRSLPTAIQDEGLMPSKRRFRDDGTKATRFHKPNDAVTIE
jgi:hypothetical protein